MVSAAREEISLERCFAPWEGHEPCVCAPVPLHVPAPWGLWDRGQWGLALQGRAGGLSGRERTFIVPNSQCRAQDFVQWHVGRQQAEQGGVAVHQGWYRRAELHPSQENNPVDPTAKKSQGRASATMGKMGETKARKGKTQMRSWEENINSCFKQHIQLSHKGLKCYRGQGARSERQMGAMKPH